MSAPVTQPTWDSNGTNAVATTGGHQTDGFAVNEVPTSTELNGWMQLVALWVAYLAGLVKKAAVRNKNTIDCLVTVNSVREDLSRVDFTNFTGVSGDGSFPVLIYWTPNLTVGETITEIHYRRFGDGIHGIQLFLYRHNGDNTKTLIGSIDESAGHLGAPPAAWGTGTLTLLTPEVVAVDTGYVFEAAILAAGVSCKVAELGYTVTPIA